VPTGRTAAATGSTPTTDLTTANNQQDRDSDDCRLHQTVVNVRKVTPNCTRNVEQIVTTFRALGRRAPDLLQIRVIRRISTLIERLPG
jgi:hypothetical protein